MSILTISLFHRAKIRSRKNIDLLFRPCKSCANVILPRSRLHVHCHNKHNVTGYILTLKNFKSSHFSTFSLLVLFCFFFSGLAGLIYQILWLRMIDKVIGSAPFAVATVLSVFMGGLALGSWLAGKYIDRIASKRNLLSIYGKVELAIGIYGLALSLFNPDG